MASDGILSFTRVDEDPLNLFYEAYIPAGLSCVFNNYKPLDKVEQVKIVYGVEDKKTLNSSGLDRSEKYKESKEVQRNKPDVFQTVYQSKPEQALLASLRKRISDTLYHLLILPKEEVMLMLLNLLHVILSLFYNPGILH